MWLAFPAPSLTVRTLALFIIPWTVLLKDSEVLSYTEKELLDQLLLPVLILSSLVC